MTLDPRRPVDDLRLLSDRLRAIEDRLDRLAAPSGTQTARAVQSLIGRATRAGGAALPVTLSVPSGSTTVIAWAASTDPEVSVTIPYPTALVTVGAIATASGLSTSDAVLAHLGLSVDGATPSTVVGDWPSVSSQNPFSGSDQTAPLQLSQLVTVTPGTAFTVSPRYGHNRYGSVVGTASVEFSARFVTVIPVP